MRIFLSEKEGKVAVATLLAYETALTHCFAALPVSPERASSDQLSAYLHGLCLRGSRPTVARALTALRGYYRSLRRRGAREDDPTAPLSLKNFSPQKRLLADGAAFDALMNTPFRGIRGRRDRILLQLLHETALSVSELVSLRRGDFDPASHRLTAGEKTVVLSASLSRALSEYAAVTALVSEDGAAPLFVNEAGQAISRQGFWKNVKARARLAGLPEEYTLQSFRREKNKKG